MSMAVSQPPYVGQGPQVLVELGITDASGATRKIQFGDWTRLRVNRHLPEMVGSFELEYDDRYRAAGIAIPPLETRLQLARIDVLQPLRIFVDGELLLVGSIQTVDFEAQADQVRAHFAGVDPSGKLLQCSANPTGPAEYKGLTLLQIGQRLLSPYGITLRAEVDVGAIIADYALDVGETVFSALDKASKLRAVLVTSDGVGGMVLTRSGSQRAPGPLDTRRAIGFGLKLDVKERYSDYYVRGQSRGHGHGTGAPLVTTASPLPAPGAPPVPAAPALPVAQSRSGAILNEGHAIDPAVTDYRPRVWVARTGAGGAPHQVLAEWRMRIARGRATRLHFEVADFRGPSGRLWRPNEVAAVCWLGSDPFDMLIDGVEYSKDEHGSRSKLSVVGIEAYDLEPLPDEHRRHRGGGQTAARGASVTRVK